MATELKMTLLLRRAEFADSCILQAGEPGYHTSTKEFKVGDGTTTWANLKVANETQIRGWIAALESTLNNKITENTNKFQNYYTKTEVDNLLSALRSSLENLITAEATAREQADTGLQNQINAKLATETFNTWKGTHENDHAPSATQIASDIADAVAAEAGLREAADNAINAKIGTGFDDGNNTVAKKIEAAIAAAAADATSKADTAEANAIAEAERKDAARATTTANNLANAVSALETKITNGDSATLQSAKDYADEKVAAEAQARTNADNALGERLGRVEAFFDGADHDGEAGGLKDALDTLVEIQTYIETEGAAADEMVKDIAQNASDIDALESRMDTAESNISTLGTNKMDKSAFDTWEEGFESDKEAHENDHAKKQTEITADIATAKSEAITKAGELDTALHTEISKEIDADVTAAINAEVTRSDAKAKELADAAEAAAKSYVDKQDTALQTAIVGGDTDATYAKTIKGAKDFAAAKATAAENNAKAYTDAREVEIKKYADQAETDAVASAKTYTDNREAAIKAAYEAYADQAEADAIAAVVGTADSDADSDTIKGVKKAYVAADTAVLNSAKAYADEKVTDAHKNYQTATVKDAAHDSATNPSFITSISIDKGHVTGATVRNLAEVLEAMEFIFDGGTSAN